MAAPAAAAYPSEMARTGEYIALINRTLYDDFTVKGKWWLPDPNPVQVDGILTVKAADDILLEVFAPLTRAGEPAAAVIANFMTGHNDWSVIHGLSDSGDAITLFNSMLKCTDLGGAGHTRAEFSVGLCMLGVWYENREDDVQFETLQLRFTHLENWVDAHPFQSTGFGDQEGPLTVTYTNPPAIKVTITNPAMTVQVMTQVDHHSSRNESVTLLHRAFIEVKPDTPLSLADAFRLMGDLQKFFTLLNQLARVRAIVNGIFAIV